MARILVIDAHPDPARALGHALASAYADGARAAGHETRLLRLADIAITPLRTATDFAVAPDSPAILAARDDIAWAEHIVLTFPLWLGSAPAHARAFFEHVARAGFLADVSPQGWTPKLKGKSARLIVTMGMPALLYNVIFGGHGVKSIARSILGFAGVAPIRTTLIGGVEAPAETQAQRIDAIRNLGRRAA